MKKLLKANATNLILWGFLTFGIVLLIVLIPAALHASDNFCKTLKFSIPIAIIFLILFWITIFYNLAEELKIKNAIIKKFSLKENEFTKVIVSDSLFFPFEISILTDALKIMNYGPSKLTEAGIDIENKTLALPYDNITPACYTLVKIFKELGGSFYLSLDDSYNIFLSLKNKENELLSTVKLTNERNFQGVLNGFLAIDSEY